MINEIKNELLLEKCIKCSNYNDLFSFTWNSKLEIKGRKNIINIFFSSCRNCAPGFEKFMRLKNFMGSTMEIIFYILFSIFAVSIVAGIAGLISDPMMGLIGFVIAGIILTIVILIYANYSFHSFNPKKFIKIDTYGNIGLKTSSGGYNQVLSITQEIDKKVQEIQETSHKICPNCGSDLKTQTWFCKVCGKNLRVV